MENINPEKIPGPINNPVIEAYRKLHKRNPEPGEDILETASQVIEGLDDKTIISEDLAKEAIHQIITMRDSSDPVRDKRAEEIIQSIETGVIQAVYPELSSVDEIHMDQEEAAYQNWKASQRD